MSQLRRYLRLQTRLSIAEREVDKIRDEMDPVWLGLTEKERAFLDARDGFDTNPGFVAVLELLNALGYVTTSSCQGHPPKTQYNDVEEWMEPYLTFDLSAEKFADVIMLLQQCGRGLISHFNDRQYVEFARSINWDDLLTKLKDAV